MAKLLSCVLGPRLYRVYRERTLFQGIHGTQSQTNVSGNSEFSWQPRKLGILFQNF
uniref:Uncharacterized protein n=1 Tax=Laticauda laticaudata TaxID=8630 RepID=A0A8C5RM75_LATLA